MSLTEWLDDETVDAIVEGEQVDPRLGRFVAVAQSVRGLGDEPLPPPSPALEAVFAGEPGGRRRWVAAGAGRPASRSRGRRRAQLVAAKLAGLGIVAKAALGTSAAGVAVVAAGAGGVLPDPVDREVRGAIEAVTPFEFDDPGASGDPGSGTGSGGSGDRGGDADGGDPGSFGDDVSRDATGESDGQPGVDGGEVSDEAPGAGNRPDQPGATGRDRADDTPAAPHVPDAPGPPDTSDDPDPAGPGHSGDTPAATSPAATAPGATAPGGTAPGRTRSSTTSTGPAASTSQP